METIQTKEIALAVLGASSTIAAILLVFVGFLFAHAETIPEEVDQSIAEKYRFMAKLGTVPFLMCIAVMLACYGWLFDPQSSALYYSWSAGFFVVSVIFVGYAVATIVRM